MREGAAIIDLEGPLVAFLREHLPRDRASSPHTIASYSANSKRLAVFGAQNHKVQPRQLDVGHLNTTMLPAFLDHIEADRDNGVRTRNARLSAIKSFFGYLDFRYPEWLDLAAHVRALPQNRANLPPVDYPDHGEARRPSQPLSPSRERAICQSVLSNPEMSLNGTL